MLPTYVMGPSQCNYYNYSDEMVQYIKENYEGLMLDQNTTNKIQVSIPGMRDDKLSKLQIKFKSSKMNISHKKLNMPVDIKIYFVCPRLRLTWLLALPGPMTPLSSGTLLLQRTIGCVRR